MVIHMRCYKPICLLAAVLSAGFILRADNGTVCVFDAASGTLLRRTDAAVSFLPADDRRQLENGLFFGSLSELTTATEDYCS